MIQPHGCDYCHQTASNRDGDILHRFPLTRRLNGDALEVEVCTHCLKEIEKYIVKQSKPL